MVQLPQPRCEVGRKCIELFQKFVGEELQRQIAYHTADLWLHLYKPKVFKRSLPRVALDYQCLKSERERILYNSQNLDWQVGEEMKQYAEEKRNIKSENEANRQFLEGLLQFLEGERRSKIQKVIKSYEIIAGRIH